MMPTIAAGASAANSGVREAGLVVLHCWDLAQAFMSARGASEVVLLRCSGDSASLHHISCLRYRSAPHTGAMLTCVSPSNVRFQVVFAFLGSTVCNIITFVLPPLFFVNVTTHGFTILSSPFFVFQSRPAGSTLWTKRNAAPVALFALGILLVVACTGVGFVAVLTSDRSY